MEKNRFECIQCGECCTRYSLDLPDGTRTEAFDDCKFLQQSDFDKNGRLKLSECKLHGKPMQPKPCKDWPFGEREGICEDGILVWSRLASRVGIERLPEKIEKILKSRW